MIGHMILAFHCPACNTVATISSQNVFAHMICAGTVKNPHAKIVLGPGEQQDAYWVSCDGFRLVFKEDWGD